MKFRAMMFALLGISLLSARGAAQQPRVREACAETPWAESASTESGEAWAVSVLTEPEGKKDDPGYRHYREGYHLVLDGRWEEARKKLGEVMKQYPSSGYTDDAEYWSAYALMHLDKKKAVAAYEMFIDRHPASHYYDDAVADYSDLTGRPMAEPTLARGVKVLVPKESPGGKAPVPRVYTTNGGHLYYLDSTDGNGVGFVHSSDSVVVHNLNKLLRRSGGKGFGYSFGNPGALMGLDRALKNQSRALRSIQLPGTTPRPFFPRGTLAGDDDLDPETRLKMEALEALGSTKHDSTSFRALKEIVLDRSGDRRLRIAAMERLIDFKKYDPLPVFLEVAKKDTGSEIQDAAIDYIGMLPKDKNRSVETLIELFYAIPNSRAAQRENIFYSIAEVGNDRAVDFLAKIARTHEKYDLRSQAVYYLGSIGNERARAALYEILQGGEK